MQYIDIFETHGMYSKSSLHIKTKQARAPQLNSYENCTAELVKKQGIQVIKNYLEFATL